MKFREKSISKLYAFALAAVFALTLAGCGGGGGTAAVEEPPPMPDPQMECVDAGGRWNADNTCTTAAELEAMKLTDAQAAAQAAYNAAKAAVDAAAANRDSDSDSYDAALQALGAAEAANSAAQAATTSGAAEAAQADAEAARDDAVAYVGMVNQAKADDDAAAAAAAAQAAANKVAQTKKKAINTEANSDTEQERPFDGGAPITGDGTANAAATSMYRLTVKHDGTMATVGVLDEQNLRKGDPKFSSVARFGDGQMLTRDIGSSREIIVLHTDIEAPTPTPFSKEHDLTTGDDPDTTAVDHTSLDVTSDHLAHVDLGVTTPDEGANTEKPFKMDDPSTLGVDEGMHRGRFNGAMGTYECASNNCSVTVNDKGKATEIVGTWTFTPDSGAMVDVVDDDYMYYGFWLATKTKDGAVTSYDTVQTFAMSNLNESALSSVTGSATYKGGAAGVYVHEKSNEDGTLDTATSGRFTADVELNAHFSGSTLRVENTIEGTISNFDLDGGPANKWNVKVTATDIRAANGFTGTASGMSDHNGPFTGMFHGSTGGTTVDEPGTEAPPVIVGEFNANFVNGTVAGAYGARLDD